LYFHFHTTNGSSDKFLLGRHGICEHGDETYSCIRVEHFLTSLVTMRFSWQWIFKSWYPTTKLHGVKTQKTQNEITDNCLRISYLRVNYLFKHLNNWLTERYSPHEENSSTNREPSFRGLIMISGMHSN